MKTRNPFHAGDRVRLILPPSFAGRTGVVAQEPSLSVWVFVRLDGDGPTPMSRTVHISQIEIDRTPRPRPARRSINLLAKAC